MKSMRAAILIVLMTATGCATTESINYQLSGVRAAGDLSAVAILEKNLLEKAEVAMIGDGIVNLMEADISRGALIQTISRLPPDYQPYVLPVLGFIPDSFPVDQQIPENIRMYIRAYGVGLTQGAVEYFSNIK